MRVFGLTGGIASGKSTVAAVFRDEGVAVVDADEVARAVVEKGSEGLAAVVEAFGAAVLAADGTLDRKALAARVFGDDDARKKLERILHPRIGMTSAARFAALGENGCELACYDAALLVENGLAEMFRPLVVVAAPRALQLSRIVARDGVSEVEANARLDAQADVGKKLAAADITIWNDADLAALRDKALQALTDVRRRVSAG